MYKHFEFLILENKCSTAIKTLLIITRDVLLRIYRENYAKSVLFYLYFFFIIITI